MASMGWLQRFQRSSLSLRRCTILAQNYPDSTLASLSTLKGFSRKCIAKEETAVWDKLNKDMTSSLWTVCENWSEDALIIINLILIVY